MNRLAVEKRVQVLGAPVEGSSINSIVRITGVAKHTILKMLEDMWPIPRHITEDLTFIALRLSDLKPMVGYQRDRTFHIIWFDCGFDLYDHG